MHYLIFLLLIVVILDVKVKVIFIRKTTVRKQR